MYLNVIILKYCGNMFFNVKILMKIHVLIIVVSLTLLLVLYGTVHGEDQIEYTLQIDSKGSVTWVIVQVVDINASLDTWEEFQNKVTSLVEAAKNKTGREMSAEVESMTFTPFGSYVVVEYKFDWKNFSKTETTKIIISDVFQVENFFLYDNGKVNITYPSEYIIETVSPLPYKRDDSHQTLIWLGTRDFTNGQPIIILQKKSTTPGLLEALGRNAIIIVSLVVILAGSSAGLYAFKRRKKKENESMKAPELIGLSGVESDEDIIMKMLKSSGGSLHQSAIVEQCKFSKAKTSQLLATLESKGIVGRYKKGRDKIVILIGKDKSEK